jgi:hypothetical protein
MKNGRLQFIDAERCKRFAGKEFVAPKANEKRYGIQGIKNA